jgi:two-component system cell cycle response regulator CtrA
MKALAIHIDPGTVSYLEKGGIKIESQQVSEPDELYGWVVDEFYDVLIVDLEASDFGMFFPHIMREKKIMMPIIGIGQTQPLEKWSEYRAEFLEQGGDDLLRATSNPRELLASIHAVFRRKQGGASEVMTLVAGDLELKIDLTSRQVSVNWLPIHLTPHERGILIALANHRKNVVSKETLLSWLYVNNVDEPVIKIIHVLICKVRKKLSAVHPDAGRFIDTVWGRGYKLVEGFMTSDSQVAVS